MNRRQFLTRAGVSASVIVAGAAYWKVELHNVEVVERTLPIVGLPMALDGKRLVQLSDLHVGHQVDDDYVRSAFRLASSLKPDIVAFTGDFITWRNKQQLTQLEYVLQDMPKGAIANVGILGNHDYGFGWSQPEVAQDVADQPQWQGYRGWMLSGHTHGGQCKIPFLTPPVLPVRNKRYAAGQVPLADGRTVYINRGIGHTLPIRVNVRPEISSFRLVRA